MGSDRRESDMDVEKPGRIFQYRRTVPGRNESGTVAAHSASHGAWPRSAIGYHHPVGDAVACTVPPCGSASTYQRSIHGRLQRNEKHGGATNSGRTADQTLSANFWQAGNPPDYWDQAAVSLAEQNSYSISDEARLLALVNLGMADAMIGCWDSKYTYSSWRPITAIQFTGSDGNNATVADPLWTPLVVTPPFPEYPSAHSCASGAAAHILSETFGEATSFAIVTLAMPGVMRQYHNFSEALADVANARVFGGIHFRTATTDGTSLGISVGDYVMQNALLAEDEKKHH